VALSLSMSEGISLLERDVLLGLNLYVDDRYIYSCVRT
jgi:hypothetical protein